jgi:hypothetical protein
MGLQHTEDLMAHGANGGTMKGADAQSVWLTCHRVLARAGDPRAAQLLDSLYVNLQARAVNFSEGIPREGFLDNIPDHRDIMAAWTASHVPN